MTNELALMLAVSFAVLCGAATGRTFALEAENRRIAVLAAAYCGAGAGILGAPACAFPLVVMGAIWQQQTVAVALARAAQVTGPALLWGIPGGAVGGLAVGIVVALVKRYSPESRQVTFDAGPRDLWH